MYIRSNECTWSKLLPFWGRLVTTRRAQWCYSCKYSPAPGIHASPQLLGLVPLRHARYMQERGPAYPYCPHPAPVFQVRAYTFMCAMLPLNVSPMADRSLSCGSLIVTNCLSPDFTTTYYRILLLRGQANWGI